VRVRVRAPNVTLAIMTLVVEKPKWEVLIDLFEEAFYTVVLWIIHQITVQACQFLEYITT